MASNFTLSDCLKTPRSQPCWDCAKACGGCVWSEKFQPIPGWVATERPMSYNGKTKATSYAIQYCPEFEPEVPR